MNTKTRTVLLHPRFTSQDGQQLGRSWCGHSVNNSATNISKLLMELRNPLIPVALRAGCAQQFSATRFSSSPAHTLGGHPLKCFFFLYLVEVPYC